VVNKFKDIYHRVIYYSIFLIVYGFYVDLNLKDNSIRIHFLQI